MTCTQKLTCKPWSSDPELLVGVLFILFIPVAATTTPALRPAANPVPTPTFSEHFLKLACDEAMEQLESTEPLKAALFSKPCPVAITDGGITPLGKP